MIYSSWGRWQVLPSGGKIEHTEEEEDMGSSTDPHLGSLQDGLQYDQACPGQLEIRIGL